MTTTTINIGAKTENKTTRTLLKFIEEFRKLNNDITAGQMAIFLLVGGTPGISMKELERASGLSSSSVSFNVLKFTKLDAKKKPGLDVMEAYEDLQDRRNKLVRLNARGEMVYNALIELLAGR